MKWIPQQEVCLSIAEQTVEAVLARIETWKGQVDVLEIRLDALAQPEVQGLASVMNQHLLFTNRPTWEGGHWAGAEMPRVALLCAAAEAGAACVDLELRAPAASWRQLEPVAKAHNCTLLASWHDFQGTPADEELREIFGQMMASGADVGKIVTTAHDFTDVLRVLHLQIVAKEVNFPLAAFCMGGVGRISRVATLALGGVLTYGAADQATATAPGQLTIAEIQEIRRCLHD